VQLERRLVAGPRLLDRFAVSALSDRLARALAMLGHAGEDDVTYCAISVTPRSANMSTSA
jgi:hypothetical protein